MGLDSNDKSAQRKLTSIYNFGLLFALLETFFIGYHAILFLVFYKKTNSLHQQTEDITFLLYLIFNFVAILPAISNINQVAKLNRGAIEENKNKLAPLMFSNFLSIFLWLYANLLATIAVFKYSVNIQIKVLDTLLFVLTSVVSLWSLVSYFIINKIVDDMYPQLESSDKVDLNAEIAV